jgi:predicted PurR-regulated permease PerM
MQDPGNDPAWKRITLFLLTLCTLILCALILRPFFSAIFGAIVLAVVTQRPYDWLSSKFKSPSVTAWIAIVIVSLSIIIPSFYLAQDLSQQALSAVSTLSSYATEQRFIDYIDKHPAIASRIQVVSDSIDISSAIQTTTAYIASKLASFLGNTVRIITQIVIMLFVLFYLFRDRAHALKFLRSLLPLRDEETTELLDRVVDAIYATALGSVAVAIIQGILAGLAFWLFGVPGVILWAFMTVVASIIPAFGAYFVWVPIAIYLALTAHWGKALLLVVWGSLMISTIDNFLYPMMIGSRLRSHTATVLISMLGGIVLFGITGVILGPVVFTIAATLLRFWRTPTAPSITPQPNQNS